MAMADKFYILNEVQFEKNGFQNRFLYKDKWITKPVYNKKELIWCKDYIGHETPWANHNVSIAGGSVKTLNRRWIDVIKDTLDIQTDICTNKRTTFYKDSAELTFYRTGSATQNLVEIVKELGGNVYVTNEEAKDKYLDEDLMRSEGIEIEYCRVPKHLKKSTFEVLEEYGIQGAIKQLPKRNKEQVLKESYQEAT